MRLWQEKVGGYLLRRCLTEAKTYSDEMHIRWALRIHLNIMQ
jgi:hypothetical protein